MSDHKGILYIVSTPIGNLQDISIRALQTLCRVDCIACEDTRKTGMLLKLLKQNEKTKGFLRDENPLFISYFEQNELARIPQIISLLLEGKNVALVSDAGTPLICDPGFKLVRQCVSEGIRVEAVPGPSSLLAALVSSGLPSDKLLFLGFLPKKTGKRKTLLINTKHILEIEKMTVIIFEGPYKLLGLLLTIKEVFGNIEVVVCKELTKLHEETIKGDIDSIIPALGQKLKGEFVVLFNRSAEIKK